MDNGDFVVVTNIDKIKFTGKKFINKKYFRHTGHPGGIKESTPLSLKEKNKTEQILKLAVKRMGVEFKFGHLFSCHRCYRMFHV